MIMKKEMVLVVGSDGRSQALAYAIGKSPHVDRIVIAPGNAGTENLAKRTGTSILNKAIAGNNVSGVMDLVKEIKPDLVVVSPETWLEKGLGDALAEENVAAIAPPKDRAILETDKAWAREWCRKWGVPQPEFQIFTGFREALNFLDTWENKDGVVKVAGLAAGKGVVVCDNKEEMRQAVRTAQEKFGAAADKILIEERLYGKEVSYIVLCDGKNIYPLSPAQDYKRLKNGDIGPNTGGMGAIAPNPAVTTDIAAKIEQEIIMPVVLGMKDENKPYVGFLYAGVMLTRGGPKLLEFNCRGGDPETQVQLMLEARDFYITLTRCLRGELAIYKGDIHRKRSSAVVVVLAAHGYPEKKIHVGEVISGLDNVSPGVVVFQAGTKQENERMVTSGGRVLGVTAVAENLERATALVYQQIGLGRIHFSGMKYRTDIGNRKENG